MGGSNYRDSDAPQPYVDEVSGVSLGWLRREQVKRQDEQQVKQWVREAMEGLEHPAITEAMEDLSHAEKRLARAQILHQAAQKNLTTVISSLANNDNRNDRSGYSKGTGYA